MKRLNEKLDGKGSNSISKLKWRELMSSTQKKLSRGASNITKIISWARGDNWRRKDRNDKNKK